MTSARRICGSSSTTRTRAHGAAFERHDRGRSAAGRVFELELAAHRRHEAARDREAEADAGAAVEIAEPLERLEDAIALGTGDAGTAVDDAEVHAVLHRARLDADPLVGRGPLQRVLDEVRDHPFEERGVADRPAASDSETSVSTTARAFAEARERGRHDFLEVDLAHDRIDRPGLQAAHVEQVADERVEAIGFVLDRARGTRLRPPCST